MPSRDVRIGRTRFVSSWVGLVAVGFMALIFARDASAQISSVTDSFADDGSPESL